MEAHMVFRETPGPIIVLAMLGISLSAVSAPAGDFLSDLFNRPSSNGENFGAISLGYAPAAEVVPRSAHPARERVAKDRTTYAGTGYCVRTCDGMYFPAVQTDAENLAEGCKKLCPASETKVFSGAAIEYAVGSDGRPYSRLPNAYRYRKELIQSCTCNGRTTGGMATVKIENDVTLKKGDLISDGIGLRVASRDHDGRGGAVQTTVLSKTKLMAAR